MNIHFAEKKIYAEMKQTTKTYFSFVNKIGEDEYKELFYPVKCRDFLGDTVYGDTCKKKVDIYSFVFDGTSQKLDEDATRLLIRFDDDKEFKHFKKRCMFPVKYQDNYALIEADPRHQKTVWQISLFSFILRSYCYPEGTVVELARLAGQDANHARRVLGNWEKLVTYKPSFSNSTGYPDEENLGIYQIHNTSGFVSLFQDKPVGFAKDNHYWKEFQKL